LIRDWERQLISLIEATTTLMMLDIADSFSIESWLDGFVSFDLSTMEDMPGVDVVRRIARLAFFADLLFEPSINNGDLDKNFSNELHFKDATTAADPRCTIVNGIQQGSLPTLGVKRTAELSDGPGSDGLGIRDEQHFDR
jgi:hypothetical protein